jgi:hypothetical protein
MVPASETPNWFSLTIGGFFALVGYVGYLQMYPSERPGRGIGEIVGIVCGLFGLLLGVILQLLWTMI